MYSVHYPCSSYEAILDILSSSKTNSSQTSSLPLADFWHPERNEKQKNGLFQGIGINNVDVLNPQKADYCFEYPTPAHKNGESGKTFRYSKPSMTDLMILLNDKEGSRITIEAKYTEYVKEKEYDPLKEWYYYKNPSESTKKNRMNILQCWIDYIKNSECGCGCNIILDEKSLEEKWAKLPYQFLHRTASACFKCSNPILVYQLFYDTDDNSKAKMKEFEELLSYYANKMINNAIRLPFFIVETEVIEYPKSAKKSVLFSDMKEKELYTFGKINVLNGYKIPQH